MGKVLTSLSYWADGEIKLILNLVYDERSSVFWVHPCTFETNETAIHFIIKEGLANDEASALLVFNEMQ